MFDEDRNSFRKIKPILNKEIRSIVDNKDTFYESEISKILMDKNELIFPLPSFFFLLKEQLTDPLNFFQIFTSALYLFDDNFYLPIFNIFILLVTNASVCVT